MVLSTCAPLIQRVVISDSFATSVVADGLYFTTPFGTQSDALLAASGGTRICPTVQVGDS